MKKRRKFLTESLQIRILLIYNELGPRWIEISRRLDVDSRTARAIINRYEKSGTLHPIMGRPIKTTHEIKDGFVGVVKFEQEITNLDLIPDKIIHNAYSYFLATYKVCVELKGECLNGQLKKI